MTDLRTPPAATSFELHELRTEHDRVVVRGAWSGTRGLRFVRPTLLVGGREVLATLDHKPWAPDEGVTWTAAFPWEGPAIEPVDAALAVTPAVTVPLSPGASLPASADVPDAAPVPRLRPGTRDRPPSRRPPESRQVPDSRRIPEVAAAPAADDRDRLSRLERERDEARAEVRRLREELDGVRGRRSELEGALEAAVAARRRAEDERDAAVVDRRRSDGWAEQQDRQVTSVRADAERVAAERDAAVRAQADAERVRDDALRRAAQAREARDETLVAYRALERRQRVGEDTDEQPAAPAPLRAVAPEDDDRTEDRPLGVVALPAARDLAADVHHVDRLSARPVTAFDVWAVRVLGSVAAVCFLGLLFLLMLTFM